jgi:Fuc2NAc and GlcNAc transferase
MGDAGSTWLGFIIAMLALLTVSWGWLSAWQWLILGAAFVTDASVTLARRLLRGEKVTQAHRRHAYQALSRRWESHRAVTLLFIAIDVVWLLPLALWAGMGAAGWLAALVAYAPLVALALLAGAGAPEVKETITAR